MTKEEMQLARRELEADLLARIRQFEAATGLTVRHVDCIGTLTCDGERGTATVQVAAEL